ncbi:hypothetical protein BLNAU_8961 [Blattamonas nauphoetae]|uniref:General stress protein FMN-binding split barrel domain-containing protein n=1 Tax=Blattamonas nauphoetae TaxID=2049346 RepID=A0ABQ9XWZ7_9EUKA|nr:hypothetical protein BLNAU_8961 [Blattamonas nauphoetae]
MASNPAAQYLLKFKDHFFWSNIISSDGTHINSRICLLMHHEKHGFFIGTKNFTRKVEQFRKTPIVTISVMPPNDHTSVVAQAYVEVRQDKEIIKDLWTDDMKKYGYSGIDDERITYCLLHILHLKHGNQEFEGEQMDYTIIDKMNHSEPLPALRAGPFQEEEGAKLIKEQFGTEQNCHLVSFKDGYYHNDRMVVVRYSDEFGLHCTTSPNAAKYREILANPNVSVLLEQRETMGQVVIDAVATPCDCLETKKKLFHDRLPTRGIKTPESPEYGLILFKPRAIYIHAISNSSPKELHFPPTKYDKDVALIAQASATHRLCYLATVSEKNEVHMRMMGATFCHPTLGPYVVSKYTQRKNKELVANPSFAIGLYDHITTDEYVIEGHAYQVHNKMIGHTIWSDAMKAVGYTGPDDESITIIRLVPTKTECINCKKAFGLS